MNRFIAERLCVTSTTVPATFLVIAGLAALVMLSNASCGSSVPTTTPERKRPTPTPTYTRTPTAPPAPTLTLLPPVTLEEPEDGSCLACGSEVRPCWSCTYDLQPGELYRLEVHAARENYSRFYYTTEDYYSLTNLSPGEYDWGIDIVRSRRREYEPASYESARYHFEIVPPPVVRSISPTSTVRGTGVTVTISGENFTHPLILTIGVPLQATFVNTSTITVTIPITLEVGEYSVIVRDSLGQGKSYASFAVSKPPTPTPIPVPTRPVYPPPVLGAVDIFGSDVTFHWSWTGNLADNDYFALRVGIGTPGESKTWTKETQASWRLTEQGDHVWEVAICRGDPAEADCSGNKQLVVSERATFWFTPPPPPNPTRPPP
jgi:hypothetical protein